MEIPDLAGYSTPDVLRFWARTMSELRDRGVTRSANNPIADYTELLVARHYGVEPEAASRAAFDVRSRAGERIQVKAARLTGRTRRNLSVIRNLADGGFDTLIAVIFAEDFSVSEVWRMPRAVVERHATYRVHVNGHVMSLTKAVLNDPDTERIALGG